MCTKQTFWRTFVAVAIMLLTMPATMWAASTFGGGDGTAEKALSNLQSKALR